MNTMVKRAKALAIVVGALALVALVVLAGRWVTSGDVSAAVDPLSTATPTASPTSTRPTPDPEIDKTVNGGQGPITVTVGDTVTYGWVVTNVGEIGFISTVDDDTHDALDGECPFLNVPQGGGGTCEHSAPVTLLTPGPVTNRAAVVAISVPGDKYADDSDSVTVYVVTPTPLYVGGIAELQEVGRPSLGAPESSGGGGDARWPFAAAGFGLALVALVGAAALRLRARTAE